ncbi:MAG: DSD1 family PLP-dependent enzyme [Alphaproteobacteria bacterium]|nr:MAG: DSD1 family PLP-dependent enzyme [Alphaproteobacteria bacterium]
MTPKLNRRQMLLLGAAGAGAAALALRPGDKGEAQEPYFTGISRALAAAGLATPTLVVDAERLANNARTMLGHMNSNHHYRIVAKSLPSVQLIERVRALTGTNRLMLFNEPFLRVATATWADADILLGKPMPTAAMAHYFDHVQPAPGFDTGKQIMWLVDTPARLTEYSAYATAKSQPMRISIEIDVGLHRGGIEGAAACTDMLDIIRENPLLQFAGFMGYEPHLASVPDIFGWRARAFADYANIYKGMIQTARDYAATHDLPTEGWVLNTGGSMTYQMHKDTDFVNELAMGSALVKPSHFDLETLADHMPAAFIATPVLKIETPTRMPVLEGAYSPVRWWDANLKNAYFIYGGNWMADPVSPKGLAPNETFGHSSNQEMLNGSASTGLKVGDQVFLWPRQSESVFLGFGDLALYENGAIGERWPVFDGR